MTITVNIELKNSSTTEIITGLTYEEAMLIMRRIAYVNNADIINENKVSSIKLDNYIDYGTFSKYDVVIQLFDYDVENMTNARVIGNMLSIAYDSNNEIYSIKKYWHPDELCFSEFDSDVNVGSFEQDGITYVDSLISDELFEKIPTIIDLTAEAVYTIVKDKFTIQSYSDYKLFEKTISSFEYKSDIISMINLGLKEIKLKDGKKIYVSKCYGQCASVIANILESCRPTRIPVDTVDYDAEF